MILVNILKKVTDLSVKVYKNDINNPEVEIPWFIDDGFGKLLNSEPCYEQVIDNPGTYIKENDSDEIMEALSND
jgi:hypothetical protein